MQTAYGKEQPPHPVPVHPPGPPLAIAPEWGLRHLLCPRLFCPCALILRGDGSVCRAPQPSGTAAPWLEASSGCLIAERYVFLMLFYELDISRVR